MAQWVKVQATRMEMLSSIPNLNLVVGESQFTHIFYLICKIEFLYSCTDVHMNKDAHILSQTHINAQVTANKLCSNIILFYYQPK